MEAFFGSWKLVDSDNFDSYLKALETEPAFRRYISSVTSVITFSQDGENYIMNISLNEAGTRGSSVSFKLGEEFDRNTIDFRFCKSVFNLEGGKLIEVQRWDDKETTIVQEVKDGELITTFTCGDVICVRTHQKM